MGAENQTAGGVAGGLYAADAGDGVPCQLEGTYVVVGAAALPVVVAGGTRSILQGKEGIESGKTAGTYPTAQSGSHRAMAVTLAPQGTQTHHSGLRMACNPETGTV